MPLLFLRSSSHHHLQLEGVANLAGDSAADVGGAESSDRVRNALESTASSSVGSTTEVDVLDDSGASGLGVPGADGLGGVGEDGGLDEDLSAHAGVDTGSEDVVVDVVDDVGGTEADRGDTRSDVLPLDVGVGDVELAGVLGGVAVGVADEGALEVVVDEGVGDGDEVRGVGDVEETVVVVLVVGGVGGQVDVVNPDVGGALDANGITVGGDDFADLEVLDDDVLGVLADLETDTLETRAGVGTDDGLVAADVDLGGALDQTLDANDLGSGVGLLAEGGVETSKVSDGDSLTTLSTSGAAVLGGVTDGGALLSKGNGSKGRQGRGNGELHF